MGKSERKAAKEIELATVSILNSASVSSLAENPWRGAEIVLADRIRRDWPRMTGARHTGNCYDTLGDVDILAGPDVIGIAEVKVSATETGTGTLANISQDALTAYQLVRGDELRPWSIFRRDTAFDALVLAELATHPLGRLGSTSKRGRAIRDAASGGDVRAATVRHAVMALARKDKLSYLSELRRLGTVDATAVEKFAWAVLTGRHTKKSIEPLLGRPIAEIRAEGEVLRTYYANRAPSGTWVVRSSSHSKLLQLLASCRDFRIITDDGENTVTGSIGASSSGSEVQLLRFILHWKNVFQGIETPCLNVFAGDDIPTPELI